MSASKDSLGQRLISVAGQRKLPLVLSYLASTAGALCAIIPFLSVYKIAEHLLLNPTDKGFDVIQFWVLIAGIAILGHVVLSYVGSYSAHRVAFHVLYDYRIRIVERLGKLPMGFFATNTSGGIQKVMDETIEKVEGFIAHMFPDLISSMAVLIALLVGLLVIDPWLAVTVLIITLLALFMQFSAFGGKKGRALWAGLAAASLQTTSRFSETVQGMAEIKLFGRAGEVGSRLGKDIDEYALWEYRQYTKSAPRFGLYKALILSMLSFLMPTGIVLIMLNPGNTSIMLGFLMALIVTPALYNPLMTCLNYGAQLGILSTSLEAIEKVLSRTPIPSPLSPRRPESYEVEFDSVSFSYQNADDSLRKLALDSLSFEAVQGQMTALVGPSGSGKSTVAQLLTRFWDIESGNIRIGGIDLTAIDPTYLMDLVALVLQDTYIFSDTVYDNISMGLEYTEDQVHAAAKAAQCHDFITKLPHGYQTRIGAGGLRLSGGEAQRVAIARVILKDSPIIILDEALAYSDAENENLIQKALEHLVHNKTVIVIAHRLQSVQNASRIYVLDKGKLLECGTHADLMAAHGEYRELWDLQHVADAWTLETEGRTS